MPNLIVVSYQTLLSLGPPTPGFGALCADLLFWPTRKVGKESPLGAGPISLCRPRCTDRGVSWILSAAAASPSVVGLGARDTTM